MTTHPDAAETIGRNFIAEFFGYRVYPSVDESYGALDAQRRGICPFLTMALSREKPCVKAPTSRGVCVVSTEIDAARYDWLVCPHRALDQAFLQEAAVRLFGYPAEERLHFIAAPTIDLPETVSAITHAIAVGEKVLLYFQEKLGGEISLARTEVSPSFAFDWTLVEITGCEPDLAFGRFGIVEVQTMDFHGSYAHAVTPTTERLASDPETFHDWASSPIGQAMLSRKMEGPNISNVFKRTFYQMVYKFQLAGYRDCAGAAFMIPHSVWISWLRHLGNPAIVQRDDGTYRLGEVPDADAASWILVFDLAESTDEGEPGRIKPRMEIQLSAERLIDLALRVSPEAALGPGGSVDGVKASISKRVGKQWRRALARQPSRSTE